MGAEIDRLEIEVEAQATKANNALDKLVGKLERLAGSLGSINGNSLSGLSTGINDLSKSMQGMKNIGTADFTRLAKNISQIGSVDTSGINKTASAINRISASLGQPEAVINGAAAIGNLANGIAKLGNKSTLNAIDNMPKLAAAMNDLMVTLSKAPVVSNNLVDMTTALANLASNGSKVGSSAQSVTNILNGYSASAQRASKSSRGLASVFGRLYANFFWVKRGADKLWQSIETSMDYVETLNYFDAAFGQVAESAVSQWEDAGAESAEAYYKSFSDRAKELTSKMSGFRINENGTLTATGQPSLGIDPEKMMNYQATFGQMASSMGVASETSLKLSQALTEIGADLASVKNLDFDKVWNDMASGLAGMSRTLDKYGVNIRNVNLQQKLNELGIQANITALNQNDKALLRAIILLENTKYAWGDLAETINQPANQLRLIESNFQNLSRTIGNLFLPAVSQTLPYVNAMVIALQRLATWIGNLLGIDLSKVTKSVAESSFDFSSIADEADAATEAVNKLQKGIRKFDELDVITTSSGSSSGSGGGLDSGLLDKAFNDAFNEYQNAWDEAFANMENQAQDLADKIEEFFAPVKNIFSDFFEGDFFAAGQDTSNLVAGILNWFADGIDNVDWYGIGENIGEYLSGLDWEKILDSVGRVFYQSLKGILEVWCGSFSKDPIATLTISFGVLKFLMGGKLLTSGVFGRALADSTGMTFISSTLGRITLGLGVMISARWGIIESLKDKDNPIRKAFDTITEEAKETHALTENEFDELQDYLDNLDFFGSMKSNFEEVKKGWVGVFDDIKRAIDKASGAFDVFIGKAHYSSSGAVHGGGGHRKTSTNSTTSLFSNLSSVSLNLGTVPKFEHGGYVPTRFSMFMAGENGKPELMFTKGGKTGVAPPGEITGIISAIVNSTQQEMEMLRQQNQLLRELVNKKWGITQDEIGESARRYAKEEYMRTGNNVFIT